jgi:ribonuclease Z
MKFTITILGCNSAIPKPGRNSSAQVVTLNSKPYLVDCGEGTQIQMRKSGIRFQKIDHIFISHLHGDHFFGLIGLISTYCLLGRTNPLHVYAPDGLREIIDLQISTTSTELTFPLYFSPIDPDRPEKIFSDDQMLVSTIPMLHRIPTSGFLFVEKERDRNIRKEFLNIESPSFAEIRNIKAGMDYTNSAGKTYSNPEITRPQYRSRSYAYCTDTAYSERILPQIRGVDLLYHESTFMHDKQPKAEERFHSTTVQAAMIASKAQAGRLLLGHFSPRYEDLQPLLEEARSVFPDTDLALDGCVFDIPLKRW